MDGLRTLGISWPPFRIFLYNTSAAFTIPPLMLCPNLASWLHKMVFKYCWRLTISHTTRDSSHFHDGKSHRLCVFLSTVKVLYAALFWFSYYIFSEPESYVFGSLISCFIFSLWCLYCYYMWTLDTRLITGMLFCTRVDHFDILAVYDTGLIFWMIICPKYFERYTRFILP